MDLRDRKPTFRRPGIKTPLQPLLQRGVAMWLGSGQLGRNHRSLQLPGSILKGGGVSVIAPAQFLHVEWGHFSQRVDSHPGPGSGETIYKDLGPTPSQSPSALGCRHRLHSVYSATVILGFGCSQWNLTQSDSVSCLWGIEREIAFISQHLKKSCFFGGTLK